PTRAGGDSSAVAAAPRAAAYGRLDLGLRGGARFALRGGADLQGAGGRTELRARWGDPTTALALAGMAPHRDGGRLRGRCRVPRAARAPRGSRSVLGERSLARGLLASASLGQSS